MAPDLTRPSKNDGARQQNHWERLAGYSTFRASRVRSESLSPVVMARIPMISAERILVGAAGHNPPRSGVLAIDQVSRLERGIKITSYISLMKVIVQKLHRAKPILPFLPPALRR